MTDWRPLSELECDGRQIRVRCRNGKTYSVPATMPGPVEVTPDLDMNHMAVEWSEIDPNHCPMCGAPYREGAP